MKHLGNYSQLNLTATQLLPLTLHSLPYFLLHQSVCVLSSTDSKYFNSTVFVDRQLWARFFSMNLISVPSRLPVIVDGIQFCSNETSWVVQFNLTHLLSDNRCSVYTTVPLTDSCLITVSSIYRSVVWLERELSDFTGINFLGLMDTRRLLLDYFEPKTA